MQESKQNKEGNEDRGKWYHDPIGETWRKEKEEDKLNFKQIIEQQHGGKKEEMEEEKGLRDYRKIKD